MEQPWQTLYKYWHSKHSNGLPPSRELLDPVVDTPTVVKNLILIEVLPKKYIYRIIGDEVQKNHGIGLTGRPVGSSGGSITAVTFWCSAVRYVDREQKAKLVTARYLSSVMAKNILLFLPLICKQGRTSHVLVGSFYDGHFPPGSVLGDMTAENVDLNELSH